MSSAASASGTAEQAAFAGLSREFSHLSVEHLARAFGGVRAVDDISFAVRRGEIVGLIGPNGAGKTTVFNLITGIDRPDGGEVYFDRHYITRLPAHRIVRLGLARTFQNIRLLGDLSVLDNVKIAYHHHCQYHLLDAMVRSPRYYREEQVLTRKAMAFLQLVGLEHLADEEAASLAYGLRRKLELARALATEGNLLLLDEPAAGLNHHETADLIALIGRINREFGITILLIEHDMRLVMSLCQRLLVMDHGKLIAAGTASEVRQDPQVIAAYLGVKRQAHPPAPVQHTETERQAD
jgi:branched-chain amino acid transport system ATP-binding protein